MKKMTGIIGAVMFAALAGQAALITSGTGTVATASSTAFATKGVAGPIIGAWANTNYAANKSIGISGTITLSGNSISNLNDKIGFGFGGAKSATAFNTNGIHSDSSYALFMSTTVNYPGTNELNTLMVNGVTNKYNTVIGNVAATAKSINYAVNILFPSNFGAGTNGQGMVYSYQLGLDYNKDGTYDMIESGSFSAFEYDRLRFGFVVSKGGGYASATSLSNDFSWAIYNNTIAIPEPATVGLFGTAAGLVLFLRRRLNK